MSKSTQKAVIIIGIMIVVVVGAALAVGGRSSNKNGANSKTSSSKTSSKAPYVAREACSILTADIAKQVAGSDATKPPTPPDTKPAGFNTSYCYYAGSKGLASLFVRSPLTKESADANAKQFSSGKPAKAQDVKGYGDAAYWDTKNYQLDILSHGTWYALTTGSATAPATRTLDQTKQYADLIIGQL